MIDWQLPVHDQLGAPPGRTVTGTPMSTGALLGAFRTADGDWVVVSCGTAAAIERAAAVVGLPPSEDAAAVEAALARWFGDRPTAESLATLAGHDVPAGRVLTTADMLGDPVFAARGDVLEVPDPDLGRVRMPAVLPHLRRHPGRVWRAAPATGQDNAAVLREWLGLGATDITGLVTSAAMRGGAA